jgi:hypothetical protein
MLRTIALCLLALSAPVQRAAAVERQAVQTKMTDERAAIEVLIV